MTKIKVRLQKMDLRKFVKIQEKGGLTPHHLSLGSGIPFCCLVYQQTTNPFVRQKQ